MIREEIRQVRNDLLDWAKTKPDEVRFRSAIIAGNLHRLEHWPDDRLMLFETLKNIADLEWTLRAARGPACFANGYGESGERAPF